MQHAVLERPTLPAAARRAVAAACRGASTGPECLDAALLMTSELVTNALRYSRGDVTLAVDAGPRSVRVEVGDEEPTAPAPTKPGEDAEGGRGLLIVDTLSTRWGVRRTQDGKVVWFELPAQP